MGCIYSCISSVINFLFRQPSNRAILTELQELKQLLDELKDQKEIEIKRKVKEEKVVAKREYIVSPNKPDSDIEASPLIENEESPGNHKVHDKSHISPGVSLDLTVLDPPPSVSTLLKTIVGKVEESGYSLHGTSTSPRLVTVVNSSRLEADMNRDLKRARGS